MRVELQGIHKSFGPVHANNDISLTLEPGHIYGILGENGAGKSTLMKILSGYQGADGGTILLDGKPHLFQSPADALAAGVGMLYQEPLDLPPFTVYENFLLGKKGSLQVDGREAAKEMLELGRRYGFEIQPEERIADLSLGERQQLELLRLLAGGAKVLILDEPTTGISAEQKELLFASMRTLAEKEKKTLILVSHKLDEVQELCDHAFVLRKGQLIGGTELPCPSAKLVGMMFEQIPPRRERPEEPQVGRERSRDHRERIEQREQERRDLARVRLPEQHERRMPGRAPHATEERARDRDPAGEVQHERHAGDGEQVPFGHRIASAMSWTRTNR